MMTARMKHFHSLTCGDRRSRQTGIKNNFYSAVKLFMELLDDMTDTKQVKTWFKAARVTDFPENGGACIRYKDQQIAVFNFSRRNAWYACQNLCPHKKQMILSR